MLELRPNCEYCDRDLPGDSGDAWICSFECTFCAPCAHDHCAGSCPNCGGELARRSRRPVAKLRSHPAATTRVHRTLRPADAAPQTGAAARMPDTELTHATSRVPAGASTRRPMREMTSGDDN